MNDKNVKLTQVGDKIVIKQDIPSVELGSKEILTNIGHLRQEINKAQDQVNKMKDNIPQVEKSIEQNNEMLKKFTKFEAWANTIQESKVRAIIDDIKEECKKAVEDTYKQDPTLSEEQNKLQMFRHYLGKLSMHKRVAEEINSEVMKKCFYTEPQIINPFI